MSIKQTVIEHINRVSAGAKPAEVARLIEAAGRVLEYPETARIVTTPSDVPAFVQQVIDDVWGLGSFDLRLVPSADDVAQAVVAAEAKALGRPLLPSERLAAHEAVSKLDDDGRIRRLAELGVRVDKPAEKPEPAAPAASQLPTVPPSQWTSDDIGQMFADKTGRSRADWLALPASQKIEIGNIYRRAANEGEPAHVARLRAVPHEQRSAADKLTLDRHERGAPQPRRSKLSADNASVKLIKAKHAGGQQLTPEEKWTLSRSE